MSHRLIVAIVAIGLVPLTMPVTRAQQSELGGRSVYVSVTTKGDVPVTGLTAADFTVKEDGQERKVLNVAPAPMPTHLAVLIDDGQALAALSLVQDLRKTLPAVFRQALATLPGTAISYWTLGDPPTKRTNFTNNITTFDAVLAVFAGRPGPGTSLVEAVYLAAGDLQSQKAPRPAIVAFLSEDNNEVATRKAETVETLVKAARASLWSIVLEPQMRSGAAPAADASSNSVRGMGDMSLDELKGLGGEVSADTANRVRERGYVLGDVSKRSGGVERRTRAKQDIGPIFGRVFTMIATRYEVSYARPTTTATFKKLEVKLKGKSGSVAAPEWVTQ